VDGVATFPPALLAVVAAAEESGSSEVVVAGFVGLCPVGFVVRPFLFLRSQKLEKEQTKNLKLELKGTRFRLRYRN